MEDGGAAAGRPRVIVADDDPAMREWLRILLRPLAAEVREAAGGLELLDLLAAGEPYDLVITDVRMPGPDGLQVVAMARTAGSLAPFLVITAFPDDELRRALHAAGACLLAKPFAPAELRAAVAALLAADPSSP
jgi:CheY-like chemotaxis protein